MKPKEYLIVSNRNFSKMRLLFKYFIDKRNILLLVVIILLGMLLLLHGIEYGLPNKNLFFSIKSDENMYIKRIAEMDISKFDFNPHFFFYGSWHFYELALALSVAALLNFIKIPVDKTYFYFHPEELTKIFLTGRLLSVALSIATIILIYLISKRFFNKKVGLLSSFFLAIMPANVINSHFLKADASLTFWATFLLFFVFRIINSDKLINYILAGIVAGFTVGSQHSGILFIHSIFFAHILKEQIFPLKRNFFRIIFDKKLIYAYFFVILCFFISSPYVILSFSEFKDTVIQMLTRGYITNIEPRDIFLLSTLRILSVGLTKPFTILTLLSVIFIIFRHKKQDMLIILWLLPYAITMLVTGILATRIQMVILPGISICIAIFVIEVLNFLKIKKFKLLYLFVIFSVIFISLNSILYVFAYDKFLASKPIQEVATEWLIENIPKATEIGIMEKPYLESVPTIIHQDYYYNGKDFWSSRFKIVNFEYDIQEFLRVSPEYFIIGEKQGFYPGQKISFPDKKYQFLYLLSDRYYVIKHFQGYPEIFNIKYKTNIVSDWHLPFLSIYILKRKQLLK